MSRSLAAIVLLGLVGCGGLGAPSANGCPSVYDGTYSGILQYEWEDSSVNPPATGTGEIKASVTLKCDEVTADQAHLSVTHAMADDPYFGCTLGGCTPDNFLSLAYLPAKPPAIGVGKIAVYMKSGNYYTQGDVNVTGGGRIISSGPTGGNNTWYGFGGATDFPSANRLVMRWPRWTFSR